MKPAYGRRWIVGAVLLVTVLVVLWVVAAIQLAVAAAAPVPYRLTLRSNLAADYSQDPPGRQFGWLRVSIVGDFLRDLGLGGPDSWEDELALALEGEVPTATAINFAGDPPNTATPTKTPQPTRTHTYTPTPAPTTTYTYTPRPTNTPTPTSIPPTATKAIATTAPSRTPNCCATPTSTKTPWPTKTPSQTKTPTTTRTPGYTTTPAYTMTPTPRVDNQAPIIADGWSFVPPPGPIEGCEFRLYINELRVIDPAFSSGIQEVKVKYWVNGWSTDYTYSDPFYLTGGGATADGGWDGYYTGGVTVKVYDLTPDPVPTAQATQPAGQPALMEYFTISLWGIATDYAGYTFHRTLSEAYTVSYSCAGY